MLFNQLDFELCLFTNNFLFETVTFLCSKNCQKQMNTTTTTVLLKFEAAGVKILILGSARLAKE